MKQLILFFVCLVTSFSAFAKNINLYDQPKSNAKIIGQIDPAAGIVPIFTPKDNTAWVKVGDPLNGNVGWIKSEELSHAGSSFSFTQSIVTKGGKPQHYQIIQVGNPKVDPKQSQAIIKKIEAEQLAIQKNMQLMMEDMFKNPSMTIPVPMVWFVQPVAKKPAEKK